MSDTWVLVTLCNGNTLQFRRWPPMFSGRTLTVVVDQVFSVALSQEIHSFLERNRSGSRPGSEGRVLLHIFSGSKAGWRFLSNLRFEETQQVSIQAPLPLIMLDRRSSFGDRGRLVHEYRPDGCILSYS